MTAIRKALANGNATLMVGSGFSLNADGGSQLASWAGLATAILDDLDPNRNKAKDEFTTALITQLGEQYARVFSQPALEDLLKRMIPDDKVSPGDLHEQLLRLPWSEIFTTNYDTLLERASERILEQPHYTVSCREDIPQSKMLNRRRIVKLHGSFPSQRPFIFTEEDYRRYPERFAPFVNLVRQSLLENIFCLIGFSGDDPNFLHWIGWVRDMLDTHSLPIYLFTSHVPTLGQRKLLEARRVTPIVLPLPKGCDPMDYPSRYAALFQRLATPLKPADAEWGGPLSFPNELLAYTEDEHEKYARLLMVFPQLRELRSTYPGWLVAPKSVRRNLATTLQRLPMTLGMPKFYEDIAQSTPLVAIVLLAQYAWQQEILLQCFDDRLAATAIQLVRTTSDFSSNQQFDCEASELKKISIKSPRDMQMQWCDLVVALLRWSREELHVSTFDELHSILQNAFPNESNLADEMRYESILLALYQGERDVARRLLLNWTTRSSDTYMDVRKASLLAEVGDVDVGLAIGAEALQRIRRNQKIRPDSARYISEEAWACLIIRNMQMASSELSWSNNHGEDSSSAKIERRLNYLAGKGSDVLRETIEIAATLNAEAEPPSQPRYRSHGFDLGEYLRGPGKLFEHAPVLIEALALYPDLRIVLSTSWVRMKSYSWVCRHLPEGLRERVIGATWHSRFKHDYDEFLWWRYASRYRQVKRDVLRRMPAYWLAIDDDLEGWPESEVNRVVCCHPEDALGSKRTQAALIERLKTMV